MELRRVFAGVGALALAAAATPSNAAELVTNGGFETGNFSGWTLGGNTGFTGVDTASAHSGTYGAYFGAVGSTGTLSQLLNTVAGQTYTVSFWLSNSGSHSGATTVIFAPASNRPLLFRNATLPPPTTSTGLSFRSRNMG